MNSPKRRWWSRGIALGIALSVGGLAGQGPWFDPQAQVRAQTGGIAWLTNLEQARQQATALGRPILVHFWNDNCPPCAAVERNVFSRPEVARALGAGFVAVKIKVDDAPQVAQWFRVDRWPMDLVLTADGRELARTVSPQDPQRYVTMLTQASLAVQSAVPAALSQAHQVAGAVVAGATNSGGAFVPPGGVTGGFAGAQPPGAAVSNAAPQSGPYGGGAPANGFSGVGGGNYSPPAPPTSFASAPAPSAAPPPAGNPALGMDGYCTVTLMDQHQWKRGDVRWGAIHRDRTYLFAGPDEQQKFLANPDRFAPMLSGFDAVLFAQQGKLVPGRRQHGVWFQEQMFLFVDEASLERFRSSPAAFAGFAEQAMRAANHPYR